MKWVKEGEDLRIPVMSWCANLEDGALRQACDLARHPALVGHVALMPDSHQGYGMPIGGVIAVKNAVLPSAVGVDIGCGMVAVETNLPAEMLSDRESRRAIQEELKARIPVGEGKAHKEIQQWEGFERYLDTNGAVSDFPNKLDRANLGTLGGGNHFIELQKSDQGFVWLMIHSGSRNLGQRVERYYQAIAQHLNESFHSPLPNPILAFLPMDTKEGNDYFRDMQFAMEYAQENRRRMMAVFRETLADAFPETEFLREVNIHHNYAALEHHGSQDLYIHRKGATSARKGEVGIIPGSMGTASYIVEGLGNEDSYTSCSHGAGRAMSRTAASETLTAEQCDAAMQGIVYERWKKFKCFGGKRLQKDILDLSEAPQAYKPIDEVIAAEDDLVKPIVRLTPLAVLKG